MKDLFKVISDYFQLMALTLAAGFVIGLIYLRRPASPANKEIPMTIQQDGDWARTDASRLGEDVSNE